MTAGTNVAADSADKTVPSRIPRLRRPRRPQRPQWPQRSGQPDEPRALTFSRSALWWSLALLIVVLTVLPALRDALDVPAWKHEVDFEVYRSAGQSVLIGRPAYDYLTPVPNLLPFTYPPMAALVAVPFALLHEGVAENTWVALQLLCITVMCAIAGRPLLRRFGRAWPVALATLVGGACSTMPIGDGLFFGQVGTSLVTLCLLDVAVPEGSRWHRWKPGWLVGLATSVKLVPGLFVVHLWVAGRRRMAVAAAGSAVFFSLLAFVVIPQDSLAYWSGALFDTSRIGAVASTYNVSLNGAALRLGPQGATGRVGWGLVSLLVAVWGLWVARRASKAGHQVVVVAIVGLLSVLLSPLSWLHHLVWIVPALLALLGDGRDWRRVIATAVGFVVFLDSLQLPWRGASDIYTGNVPLFVARLEQSSYTLGSVLLILALDLLVVRCSPGAVRPSPVRGSD